MIVAVLVLIGCAQTSPVGFDPNVKIDDQKKYFEEREQELYQLNLRLAQGAISPEDANLRRLRILGEIYYRFPEANIERQNRKAQALALWIDWSGVGQLGGILNVEVDPRVGDVSVDLPDAGGTCRGFWGIAKGAYQTPNLPSGHWVMFCPNGMTGEGKFHSPQPRRGSGEGLDSKGRKISFVYNP
jgi:hypothetical protein